MELVEYSATIPWGEYPIARKIEQDPERPGLCHVCHPDAGGRCEEPAVHEVYGLAFCETHGAEAAHAAIAELCKAGFEDLERPDNPHVPALNPATLDVLHEGVRELIEKGNRHEYAADAAAMRAYPEILEQVDSSTVRWSPEDRAEPRVDFWANERELICKLMRLAFEDGSVRMVEALEPFREEAAAQFAFAKADYERKVGAAGRPGALQ